MTWSALPASTCADAYNKILAAKPLPEPADGEAEGEEAAAPAPESPAPIEDALEAAVLLLEDEAVKAAIGGADAAEDFSALIEVLAPGATPHPAVLSGLKSGSSFSLRGWQCDLPSLCALLAVLASHASVTEAKLWGCGLDATALALLVKSLPGTGVDSLALEGDGSEGASPCAAALAELLSLPKVAKLLVRNSWIGGDAAVSAAPSLTSNATLTSLSLFGNPIGDEGALALLSAIRTNEVLTSLDLSRTSVGDATAEGVLEIVKEPPPPPEDPDPDAEAATKEDGGGEPAEGEEGAPAAEAPPTPNRTLTAINLSHNAIGVAGRRALELAQEQSPGLTKLGLSGNPCLSCGPAASMSKANRAAIAASWAALGELEGGAAAVCKRAALAALEKVPEARPLVGYVAPTPRAPAAEGEGEDATPPPEGGEDGEGAPVGLEGWGGLDGLAEQISGALDACVKELDDPSALGVRLADLGLMIASRKLPLASDPFDVFGSCLMDALGEALGAEGLTEDAANAWRQA
jgi:hypothetical protein